MNVSAPTNEDIFRRFLQDWNQLASELHHYEVRMRAATTGAIDVAVKSFGAANLWDSCRGASCGYSNSIPAVLITPARHPARA